MPDVHADIRNPDMMTRRAEAVRRQQAASVKAQQRAGNVKVIAIGALALGLSWSVWNMNRLAGKAASRDTEFAVLQPNGEFISSTHYSDIVPKAAQADDVTAALWTYVQARDCYSSSGFTRAAYVAQAMSDLRVGKQVQNEFDLTSPDAPQHVYGEHGITIQCETVDPPTPIGDSGNQYLFRFRRWEDDGHPVSKAMAPFYTATVTFRTGIYPMDDKRRAWADRATFNPPGVQVIDYPGAKPENAEPIKHDQRAELVR